MQTRSLASKALALLLLGTPPTAAAADSPSQHRRTVADTAAVEIFTTPSREAIPYRIPAITTTRSGHLVAVADYRHSRGDIGTGRLDLHARLSKDNGRTWSRPFTIVEGDGRMGGGHFNAGFGDPAIVADRESNDVLLLSCAGDITYQAGTQKHHQGVARFRSKDGGQTWSAPEDITDSIYSLFPTGTDDACDALFVGSGRIFQSRTVKAGTHYRLYCSVLYKDLRRTYKNYVLYSDDFGQSWHLLGDAATPPIPRGADEPKTEEMPDGSVLVSSRCGGGRIFNLFRFTDAKRAEGSWGQAAVSNESTDGVVARQNSTNGEVLVVPAVRKADGRRMHLLLQSVPFGPGRANVGICYKALESPADYATPEALAGNWTGRMQVSGLPSAYSTMTLQWDKSIGFLYEESTHGADYTIVYRHLTLEEITAGTFAYDCRRGAARKAHRHGAEACRHGDKFCQHDDRSCQQHKKGLKQHKKAHKQHKKAVKQHKRTRRQGA